MADLGEGLRLRIPVELSVPRLLRAAGYQVETTAATQATRVLYDTGDRRLAAAGAELSRSARDGWRWRRASLGHPKLPSREWRAPTDAAQSQVAEWARAYHRGRAIAARATVAVQTRQHQVSRDAAPLMTLREERTDERVPSGYTPRARHLEVIKASKHAGALLTGLREVALEDEVILALARPQLVRAPRVALPAAERTDGRDLFVRSTTLSLIQWLFFDCELGAGSPDALRKLRVALRRLRSDLQTFNPLLDRTWADGLRAELGDLGGRLGTVRDAEVLCERLAGLVALLPDGERAAALPLLDTAGEQLAAARAELLEEMNHRGYLVTLDRVVAAVAAPHWGDHPDGGGAAQLARRPWRRLRRFVEDHGDHPDDVQLHRLRILAKRTRYACDACVPAAGEAAAASATRLASLQTVLGEHHDAVVTRGWLHRELVAISDLSFVAGELAALELRRMEDVDRRWREAWHEASRPERWRWLRS